MKGKTPITVIDDLPGDTVETYEHDFQRSAYVTGLRVSTYVGQAFALRYKFERVRDDTPTNLLNQLGKEFVAGNGEELNLPLRERFEEGDTLRITVENTTGRNGATAYEYHASARLPVEYDTSAMSRLFGARTSGSGDSDEGGFLGGVL